jgi:hypothetical protein
MKLHNDELHNLYSSTNIIRKITWKRDRLTGHKECNGKKRKARGALVSKPEGKRSIERHRYRGRIILNMY